MKGDLAIHHEDGTITCYMGGKLIGEHIVPGTCEYNCQYREHKWCSKYNKHYPDPVRAEELQERDIWDTAMEKDSVAIGINSYSDLERQKQHLLKVFESKENR